MKKLNLRKAEKLALAVLSRRQRHAALILKNGNLVAFANNEKGHAEQCALKSKVLKTKLEVYRYFKGCTLISFRVKPSGEIGNSKPCINCDREISEAGIRKLIFFDGECWIEELRY